jgi:hypothetical protein
MGEGNLSTLKKKVTDNHFMDRNQNKNLFLSLASNQLFVNGMGMALLLDTSSSSINIDPLSSFLARRSQGKSLRVFYLLESGTVPQIEISIERIP